MSPGYNEAARVALARLLEQKRRDLTWAERRTLRRIRARWRLAERRRRRATLELVKPQATQGRTA